MDSQSDLTISESKNWKSQGRMASDARFPEQWATNIDAYLVQSQCVVQQLHVFCGRWAKNGRESLG